MCADESIISILTSSSESKILAEDRVVHIWAACKRLHYEAEVVFRSVRKITYADWLQNCTRFYDIGSTGPYALYFRPASFGGKIFALILVKVKES